MHTLRKAPWITRLVLAGFVLCLAAALASPVLRPASGQMVCSAMGGMKQVPTSAPDESPAPMATLECPLCMPVLGPTTALQAPGLAPSVSTPSSLPRAAQAGHAPIRPWQARAPPLRLA